MAPSRWALALLLALIAGVPSHALYAQAPVEDPNPLVESLKFTGVESVNRRELAATLSTEATHCRVFLLKPLCSITRSKLFEARHYLDHDQLRRDVLRIKVFYWLRGFRNTQVDTVVVPKRRGVAVTFNVTEGPPTLVQELSVRQSNELVSERRLQRWGLPQQGQRIDLTQLDSLKVRTRRFLWDMGYGNAFIADSALPIGPQRVALKVDIDAGAITTVDTVMIEGNEKVSDRTVGRLVGLRRGDLYKRADLLEAQRRLYRSDLFRQTMIIAPDSADTAKLVLVTVTEAPMRAAQLGAGLNTVEFGQLQANLTLFNFHGAARRVELHSVLSNLLAKQLYGKGLFGIAEPLGVTEDVAPAFFTPTWQLSATISQPWLFSRRNSASLSVFSNRRSVPNIVIDRGSGASATFTRTLSRDLPLSLTYRYERTQVQAGELYFCVNFGYCRFPTIDALRQSKTMSPFVLSLRADRTDDPLQPTSGYTARFDAQHASAATASNWRFNRIEADFAPYFKLGTRRSIAVRAHAGRVAGIAGTNEALGITGLDGVLLHPRSRFFAGGARSVRGYAEGQLGPRVLTIAPARLLAPKDSACTAQTIFDRTCDPNVVNSKEFIPRAVGGNSLLEGTVEYRMQLGRSFGAAVFVDAGRVGASNLGELLRARSAVTPGVGFRYTSPIGPIRVDLGLRPSRIEELPVMTQITDENGELRLVELIKPMKYDPAAGPHGFLGKITSRLQLHLYIGEAY